MVEYFTVPLEKMKLNMFPGTDSTPEDTPQFKDQTPYKNLTLAGIFH